VLDRAFRMNRRRLGILRVTVVVVTFACAIHLTHRDCATSADSPLRSEIFSSAPSENGGINSKPLKPEEFNATAYCVTGLTASGVPVAPGHVSADPKVIPLGSMIYVETPFMSGVYQVMDTGELIKGKIIDIFIPSYESCMEFGRRIVKVKVLRHGFKGEPQDKKSSKSEA
jgi:3D (Asp-Asp-Asp) domain-containing protein